MDRIHDASSPGSISSAHLGQYLLDDVLVIAQDFIECIWLETVASLQVDKLSEEKPRKL